MQEGGFFEKKPEILPEVPTEESGETERLKTIAQIIGGDFGMKVETGRPGEGSKFDAENVKITLDPEQIKTNKEESEYTVAHEGSHRAITLGSEQMGLKIEKIKEYYNELGFSFLVNTLEDTAVDTWAVKKFEGLKPLYQEKWSEAIKRGVISGALEARGAMEMLGRTPKFVRFGHEIYKFWHEGKFSEDLDPVILKALEKTQSDWQKVYQEIPGLYRDRKDILDKARERFSLASGKIWPEFQKLVEEDLSQEKIKQMLEDFLAQGEKALNNIKKQLSHKEKKELQEHLKEEDPTKIPLGEFSPALNEALQKAFNKLPKEIQEELGQKARQNFEKLEDALTEDLKGKLNLDVSPSHKDLKKPSSQEDAEKVKEEREKMEKFIEKGFSVYERHYKEIASLIDELYNKLEKIFLPQKYPRWETGFPAGGRISLKKAMEFEKESSKYTEIFQRKTMPQKQDYRFSLLVDLSSSMAGEKIKESFKAMILISEVLNKLGIKFEVNGFSDGYASFKKFEENLEDKTRERLGEMLKTQGDTHMGHALRESSKTLGENRGKENFLIAISDGDPTDITVEEAKELVEKIHEKTDQKPIGIGLGPGIMRIKDIFPQSVRVGEAEKLPDALAQLFEDIILKRT